MTLVCVFDRTFPPGVTLQWGPESSSSWFLCTILGSSVNSDFAFLPSSRIALSRHVFTRRDFYFFIQWANQNNDSASELPGVESQTALTTNSAKKKSTLRDSRVHKKLLMLHLSKIIIQCRLYFDLGAQMIETKWNLQFYYCDESKEVYANWIICVH